MAAIEIYTTSLCPYCARAKNLLHEKGASFEEFDVDFEAGKREEMLTRAGGRRTVPQIFINGAHIGGCDDLIALDQSGKLDTMLTR